MERNVEWNEKTAGGQKRWTKHTKTMMNDVDGVFEKMKN